MCGGASNATWTWKNSAWRRKGDHTPVNRGGRHGMREDTASKAGRGESTGALSVPCAQVAVNPQETWLISRCRSPAASPTRPVDLHREQRPRLTAHGPEAAELGQQPEQHASYKGRLSAWRPHAALGAARARRASRPPGPAWRRRRDSGRTEAPGAAPISLAGPRARGPVGPGRRERRSATPVRRSRSAQWRPASNRLRPITRARRLQGLWAGRGRISGSAPGRRWLGARCRACEFYGCCWPSQ